MINLAIPCEWCVDAKNRVVLFSIAGKVLFSIVLPDDVSTNMDGVTGRLVFQLKMENTTEGDNDPNGNRELAREIDGA